jgi:hypothetical protein
MNDRRPEPSNKSIENQRKLVKTFTVLFGYIVAPALAVGYAFLLGWTNWALLAVLVSVGLIQLWAYRKRPLLGRSQRRLVFTTTSIVASVLLSATLGWWSALLTLVVAVFWYSQYQMWSARKHDPWESMTRSNLPHPKLPKRLRNKIDDPERVVSVERKAWVAMFIAMPKKDDLTALVVMTVGIGLSGAFMVGVIGTPGSITLVVTLSLLMAWCVVWWLMLYFLEYIVCTEESIVFIDTSPWGRVIPPVMFDNILTKDVDPKYFSKALGYTSITINTAATDGDDKMNRALKYVKYPGPAWFIMSR